MSLQCRQSVLANGIIVATDTADQFESVAVSVSFRIGSVHEPDHLCGISHLLEHVIFRGSQSRNAAQIQNEIASLGGYLNAVTQEDATTYQAVVLHEDLPAALSLIADIVSNPTIATDDVALEKQIIEQENCRGCDTCSMREAFYQTAYPEQSLRLPVIGYADTVNAITSDDLRAYHAQNYVARNLTIALSGRLDHDEVVAHIADVFDDLPEGTAAGYPSFVFTPDEVIVAANSDRARIRIGLPMPNHDRTAMRALDYYASMLGGHGESLLMRELRERRGLVYHAWADTADHARNSVFFVEASGDSATLPEIIDVTLDCMRNLAQDLPEDVFESEKARFVMNERMGIDSLTARVQKLSFQVAQYGCLLDDEERVANYRDMPCEAVGRAARWLLRSKPSFVATGPIRQMPDFEALRARLARGIVADSPSDPYLRFAS